MMKTCSNRYTTTSIKCKTKQYYCNVEYRTKIITFDKFSRYIPLLILYTILCTNIYFMCPEHYVAHYSF